jgi:hypothetical protein
MMVALQRGEAKVDLPIVSLETRFVSIGRFQG